MPPQVHGRGTGAFLVRFTTISFALRRLETGQIIHARRPTLLVSIVFITGGRFHSQWEIYGQSLDQLMAPLVSAQPVPGQQLTALRRPHEQFVYGCTD
jgi:hypothetical protein